MPEACPPVLKPLGLWRGGLVAWVQRQASAAGADGTSGVQVSANIFRQLPTRSKDTPFDPEEDEPILEPACAYPAPSPLCTGPSVAACSLAGWR